jgi:hypothetical protein
MKEGAQGKKLQLYHIIVITLGTMLMKQRDNLMPTQVQKQDLNIYKPAILESQEVKTVGYNKKDIGF